MWLLFKSKRRVIKYKNIPILELPKYNINDYLSAFLKLLRAKEEKVLKYKKT